MIKTIEHAEQLLSDGGTKFYKIIGRSIQLAYDAKDSDEVKDVLEKFREHYNMLDSGTYQVYFSSYKTDKKPDFFSFTKVGNEQTAAQIGFIGYNPELDSLKSQLAEMQKKIEIDAIERKYQAEIEALKKDQSSSNAGFDKFQGAIGSVVTLIDKATYFHKLSQGNAAAAVPTIAGASNSQSMPKAEQPNELTAQLQQHIFTLQERFPSEEEFVKAIGKLASIAANNPSQFQMLLNML